MKRIALLLTLSLSMFAAALAPASVVHASVEDFSFRSFSADYYLARDNERVGGMKVVEKLVAKFPDYDQNHGIRRAIPTTYKGHKLHLNVSSITDQNGVARPFTTAVQNDNLIISIRSDSYLRGEQTYVITYSVNDVITFYTDHDELYWDTNGDQWPQQFDSVVANVHVPAELSGALQDGQKCFTGSYGEAGGDCAITREQQDGGTLITFGSTRPLIGRENLSFVLGFDKGTFKPYKIPTSLLLLYVLAGFTIFVLPPLVAFIIMWRRWLQNGRDARGKGVIIAQYAPQPNMNPLLAGMVLQELLPTRAISAAIMGMCIAGQLRLYAITTKKLVGSKTSYELELIKRDTTSLSAEELRVLDLLFPSKQAGSKVLLDSLKNKLAAGATSVGAEVSATAASEGYFSRDPQKVQSHYVLIGALVAVPAFMLLFVPFVRFYSLGVLVAGVIVIVFGRFMPARTAKGVEARDYLKGMELYMKMAEAERIKMLQSPTGAEKVSIDPANKTQLIKLYEKLLPYAMLFGIEAEWAKQFADLYTQPPTWYSGNTAFNAAVFASSMNGFTTAAANSFTAPSSSSSSGFGGGGFSGGGGGGGGGGGI